MISDILFIPTGLLEMRQSDMSEDSSTMVALIPLTVRRTAIRRFRLIYKIDDNIHIDVTISNNNIRLSQDQMAELH